MLLAADGALSLKVTSIGIPFRILSPKHGIFVNADACAFQSLLVKAVLSSELEEFQDNLNRSVDPDTVSCEPVADDGSVSETSSVVCRSGSVPRCRASEDAHAPESDKRFEWAVFRADETGLIW